MISGDVIVIDSSEVVLDLDGKTLASEVASDVVIRVQPGRTEVTVRNGRLRGANHGVFQGPGGAGRVRLENLEVIGPDIDGIHLETVASADVVGCRVRGAGNHGIFVQGFTNFTGFITDNVVENVGGSGIRLPGMDTGVIRGNIVNGYGGGLASASGIAFGGLVGNTGSGNLIEHNTISNGGNDDNGITLGNIGPHRNVIRDNAISLVGEHGIHVRSSGNRVTGNVLDSISGDGVLVEIGNRNLIENNQVNSALGCGIRLVLPGLDHVYRDNVLLNNNGGGVCDASAIGIDGGGNIIAP